MTRLQAILHYFRCTRGAGHTQRLIDAAHAMSQNGRVIMLVGSEDERRRIERHVRNFNFRVMLPNPERLHGHHEPLFIDHFCLDELVREHDQTQAHKISALCGEIERLNSLIKIMETKHVERRKNTKRRT